MKFAGVPGCAAAACRPRLPTPGAGLPAARALVRSTSRVPGGWQNEPSRAKSCLTKRKLGPVARRHWRSGWPWGGSRSWSAAGIWPVCTRQRNQASQPSAPDHIRLQIVAPNHQAVLGEKMSSTPPARHRRQPTVLTSTNRLNTGGTIRSSEERAPASSKNSPPSRK